MARQLAQLPAFSGLVRLEALPASGRARKDGFQVPPLACRDQSLSVPRTAGSSRPQPTAATLEHWAVPRWCRMPMCFHCPTAVRAPTTLPTACLTTQVRASAAPAGSIRLPLEPPLIPTCCRCCVWRPVWQHGLLCACMLPSARRSSSLHPSPRSCPGTSTLRLCRGLHVQQDHCHR